VQFCPPLWSPVANLWTPIQQNGCEYGRMDVASVLLLGRASGTQVLDPYRGSAGSPQPKRPNRQSHQPPPGAFRGSRGPALQHRNGTIG